MAAISTYLANIINNEVLRNTNYTPVATVYLAAYTTNPTAADTGTEVTGGSYARQAITWTASSAGSTSSAADVNFATMPATTVAYLGIRDALSGGNLLFYGPLAAAKTLNAGDTFTVKAGDLINALS